MHKNKNFVKPGSKNSTGSSINLILKYFSFSLTDKTCSWWTNDYFSSWRRWSLSFTGKYLKIFHNKSKKKWRRFWNFIFSQVKFKISNAKEDSNALKDTHVKNAGDEVWNGSKSMFKWNSVFIKLCLLMNQKSSTVPCSIPVQMMYGMKNFWKHQDDQPSNTYKMT